MTLEDKKKHIYRLVKLGMDRAECELLAECSLEEQTELEKDAYYLAHCAIQRLLEEKDLLERLEDIIEMNTVEGKSTEVRWKLEKINNARWGNVVRVASEPVSVKREPPDLSKLTEEQRAILLDTVCAVVNPGQDKG
jgi:DNA replication initiation complex subunit (GINS family)